MKATSKFYNIFYMLLFVSTINTGRMSHVVGLRTLFYPLLGLGTGIGAKVGVRVISAKVISDLYLYIDYC